MHIALHGRYRLVKFDILQAIFMCVGLWFDMSQSHISLGAAAPLAAPAHRPRDRVGTGPARHPPRGAIASTSFPHGSGHHLPAQLRARFRSGLDRHLSRLNAGSNLPGSTGAVHNGHGRCNTHIHKQIVMVMYVDFKQDYNIERRRNKVGELY